MIRQNMGMTLKVKKFKCLKYYSRLSKRITMLTIKCLATLNIFSLSETGCV